MSRSNPTIARRAKPPEAIRAGARRLQLLFLARPRLISNLLALVALFSIGFV